MAETSKQRIWGSLGRDGEERSLTFALLNTPTNLSLDQGFQFVEQPRIAGKPSLQKVGGELKTLDFSLEWHEGWCNPQVELNKLLRLAGKQEAQALVIGDRSYGNWVIERVSQTFARTDINGVLLQASADVTLKEWTGENPPKRRILRNTSFRKVFK